MAPSEQGLPYAFPQQVYQRLAAGGRWGIWLSMGMVVAVIASLAALLLVRAGMPGAGTSSKWQTYHDSFGLYTLQLPPGWAPHVTMSTVSYGNTSGSATIKAEIVSFGDPSQGAGSAHVYTLAYPIKTAFDHQFYCQPSSLHQGFSPMTLNKFEQSGALSLFVTKNAYFQIDAEIPGVLAPERFGPSPPTATPLPASWLATDKTDVNKTLTSFRLTDPMPLAC
jgi:hypothetical protein